MIAVTGENSLVINNVSLDDAGAYICQASNAVGRTTLTIHLQIVGQCGDFEMMSCLFGGHDVIQFAYFHL
mgnify:CR=1 FL=1